MIWKPDVTVAAIIEEAGRFLFVEERIGTRLVLNQPAGHLEEHESLQDAVVRETLEETAWQFHPTAITGIYLWHQPDRSRSFLRVTFCGTVSNHNPERILDEGICRTLWLTREQIMQHIHRLRSPMVLQGIDEYLQGVRYPLHLLKHFPVNSTPVTQWLQAQESVSNQT